jgi:hypothetical protein
MRTLHLTTPLMRGEDVKLLQAALERHGYYHGPSDGIFGILTAQACYRAKYWFGYRKPDKVGGPLLLAYLQAHKKPSTTMRLLALKRKNTKKATPLRVHALDYLKRHLGDKESPAGSNRVSWASVWYGVIGPWCAMSCTRAYVEAGSKAFKRGARYAYVPYIVADARAGRNHLTVTRNPQPGDLVCYDWDHDGIADHVGLFERWEDRKRGFFYAIEGNTAVGNDSNGGEVMRRERYTSFVQVFIHVGA